MIFPKRTTTLLQLIGPSMLLVALSINGGELLLWPEIIARHGFSLLWLVPIILILQYFVNMEIERYTVVTGQNTLSALIEKFPYIRYLFILSMVVSLVWPAWALSAGSMSAFLFGLPAYGQLFGIGILLALSFIWSNKKSYNILESIAKTGLITVLCIIVFIIISRYDTSLNVELLNGIGEIGKISPDVNKFSLLSALAYGGVVGVLNLVQSDWVKNKGYGVAGIKKPEKVEWTSESIQNFRDWWRFLRIEHTLIYFVGNLVAILILASVAYLTVFGENIKGFAILTTQVTVLNNQQFLLGTLFGFGVILLFTMAQMTILETMGKLLHTCIPKLKSASNTSRYLAYLGIVILLLGFIFPEFTQPAFLLKLSASLSAFVMVLYTPLLLILNRTLPEVARPNVLSQFMVISCFVFYGIMVIWSVI
jgi:hypothetical protein